MIRLEDFTEEEQVEVLEVARWGLAMVFTDIAEEMDLSDEYLSKLQDKIYAALDIED